MTILDPRSIVAALGGDVTGRDSCNVPGPNHSPRDRSLSIVVRGDGFMVHSHCGDDWKECRDYVRAALGIAFQAGRRDDESSLKAADNKDHNKAKALKIWSAAIDPRGTLAEKYLREHRGLTLPDAVAGSVIRFHRRLNYDQWNAYPAMVCLLRDIGSDEPCGIHRTFLDRQTAAKIDRRMLGIAKGAAIKFDAPSASLTIGEGVETVLAAREAGFTPAWALGSSVAIRFFPVLASLRELAILGENDSTSARDVARCASRYVESNRSVNIIQPMTGSDFADAWRARA